MKGSSFHKPLEFKITVEGEKWRQEDSVKGSLTVINQGSEPVNLDKTSVVLARGDFKKVRAKSDAAFKVLDAKAAETGTELKPGSEHSFSWEFKTERNCPITDNTSSLFIVYGQGEAHEKSGQLQLNVLPAEIIDEFIDVFVVNHRFVRKAHKYGKEGVDVKMAPPTARGFSSLEQLLLSFKFEEDQLRVRYTFSLKKIEAKAASVDVSKLKKEVEQLFTPKLIKLSNGHINFEAVDPSIKEALDLVESKVSF
jgi:hypothetical protein